MTWANLWHWYNEPNKGTSILQGALEEEEIEEDKRSRGFKALEKCEKNGGVGMLLRCLRVMENVTFLSELNQVSLLYGCFLVVILVAGIF